MATFPFSGGEDAILGYGQKHNVVFTGTWTTSSLWTLWITSDEGDFALGRGWIGGSAPEFGMTMGDRMHVVGGHIWSFSENGDPTGWNEQNPGAGYVLTQQQQGIPDDLVACSQFQGRAVLFGKDHIQIWTVDSDPNNFFRTQTLQNIGTIAKLSVQAKGDLDVYFLDRTGFRSLQYRSNTLNAYPDDVGTAIDQLVQSKIAETDDEGETSCAIIDPKSKRYWCFVYDTIFVLSVFPQSKITAWSTYVPTWEYNGEQIEFTPEKFVILEGLIYCRSVEGGLLTYGDGTYDNCTATAEFWLDANKPEHDKTWEGIGVACEGAWVMNGTTDQPASQYEEIARVGVISVPNPLVDSTFDKHRIPFTRNGTHIKLQFQTISTYEAVARLTAVHAKYTAGNIQ